MTFEMVEATDNAHDAKVKLIFADGETCCESVIGLEQVREGGCTLRGKVMQLVQGEEGFYERSTEVTHFFELSRTTCCEAQAEHTRLLEQARRRRLERLSAWIEAASLTEEMRNGLQSLPWIDIIVRDATHLYEDQCATLRRQSALLDSLSFTTVDEKDQILARLRRGGLNRLAAHTSNDAVLVQLKNLLSAFFPAMARRRSEEDVRQIQVTVDRVQQRMTKSYSQFDQSFSSVETRLPRCVIEGWLKFRGEIGDADPCSVCYLPLDDGSRSVRLPCGHWFHLDCISQWLHTHATCPNCRIDLGQPSGASEPPKRG